MTTIAPLVFWHVVIEDKQLGPLPEDLDPGLLRPAYAKDVRPGDLVVGHFDGSARRRWAWTAAPGAVCYRALPQRHPSRFAARAVSLHGILTDCVDLNDEVLIVPAALYPADYQTTRDMIRHVDPDTIAYDRRTYGVTPGDRVCAGGRTGVLLEIHWPGYGLTQGRVLWDAAEPGAEPAEETRPVERLKPAPVELIAQWLSLPQG